jgi:hypothetical protein
MTATAVLLFSVLGLKPALAAAKNIRDEGDLPAMYP